MKKNGAVEYRKRTSTIIFYNTAVEVFGLRSPEWSLEYYCSRPMSSVIRMPSHELHSEKLSRSQMGTRKTLGNRRFIINKTQTRFKTIQYSEKRQRIAS